MKIKICGLSREKDIEAVNEAMPDYIGFVFAKSKRQINEDMAIQLKYLLNPNIKAVGVFVNEDIKTILRYVRMGIINIIQLHGDESKEYIDRLRDFTDATIIKAIRVQDMRDIQKAREVDYDYLLFDTYQKSEYGGSGTTFDWGCINDMNKPYFLAGGIHTGNVMQAINQCNPYCIDVSSGVETDGWKDAIKIKELVTKIRSVG